MFLEQLTSALLVIVSNGVVLFRMYVFMHVHRVIIVGVGMSVKVYKDRTTSECPFCIISWYYSLPKGKGRFGHRRESSGADEPILI